MNTNLKKALLVFGGGFLAFWAFKKIRPIEPKSKKSSSASTSAPVTDEKKKNAVIVMKAYQEAVKAGESKSFLDDMNSEFAQQFSLKVYKDRGTGKLFVSDLEGTKII